MNNCSKKNCIISVIAVFAFTMIYDMLVHGQLMMDMYKQTASLWRTDEEMQSMFAWCFVYHALLAMVVTCFYGKFMKGASACAAPGEKVGCPRKMSLCFGMKVGMIMGLMHASSYIWMPIPASLAIAWFVIYLVQGIGMGFVLSLVCKKDGASA